MTSSHGRFIWYELMTTDADAAAAFYGAVVGWRATDSGQAPKDYRLLSIAGENVGGMLQLSPEMRAGGASPGWLGYVCVDDVDAAVASITKARGRPIMPAMEVPGVGRMAMVADPQGVPIYVMTPTPPAGGGVSHSFSPDRIGHCAWNELATSNQAGALDFYTGQFGWTKGDAMPMGEMGDYQFIHHGDEMIGAVMNTRAGGPPPNWKYCFRIDDIDVAVKTVSKAGGEVTSGPQEVPGGGHVISATDPQGAVFMLIGEKI